MIKLGFSGAEVWCIIKPENQPFSGVTMNDDAAIARHIEHYGKLFAEQVERAGGWPAQFTFPEPASDAACEALRLFVEEVELTTGAEMTLVPVFEPQS